MKLLSFTILILFSFSSYAVEFYRCIDDKGQAHFTNLPKVSLGSNCAAKDRHTVMLKQDYSNLDNEFKKYEISIAEPEFEAETKIDVEDDRSVTQRVKDAFDSDKAYEELMTTVDKRDDAYSRKMRENRKAFKSIVK